MTLRTRLITAFLAATLLPLVATLWITTTLVDRSLQYATTDELDRLSRTLETTAKQFYQHERDALREDALAGRTRPVVYAAANAAAWPDPVRSFWDSGESERFGVSGASGERIEYLRRIGAHDGAPGVEMYSRDLGGVSLAQLSTELRNSRDLVNARESRDLRRGFTLTLLVLLGVTWVISLVPLIVIAHRVSRPIQQLTAALTDFAGGDWSRRVETKRKSDPRERDEVGRAVDAFNHMAGQLEDNRERLVHLTRMASWQSLARKTAHELKNSLTPIRLMVEEMQARSVAARAHSDDRVEEPVPSDHGKVRVEGPAPSDDAKVRVEGPVPSDDAKVRVEGTERAFMDQAVQIVVSEIESLERRVRAFSEFATEPQMRPESLDINAVVSERVRLLQPAHPDVSYQLRLVERQLCVHADADLVNGVLTNLLQNAAEAAGPGGVVIVRTLQESTRALVEIHDSGPGLGADVVATLFEPTISFKKHGMGLGLSIAKKNALLCGGDIGVIPSQLGGAAFRVLLPL